MLVLRTQYLTNHYHSDMWVKYTLHIKYNSDQLLLINSGKLTINWRDEILELTELDSQQSSVDYIIWYSIVLEYNILLEYWINII